MNLEPGRELDALIAQKVMGIQSPNECSDCRGSWRFCSCSGSIEVYAPYSTEISAAWEVVERFTTEKFFVSLNTHPHGCEVVITEWLDGVDEHGDQNRRITHALGETAPLAICLVSLKAVTKRGNENG